MKLIIYQLMLKIAQIEWRWNKDYMQNWSRFVERVLISLKQIKIKNKYKCKFQGQSTRSQRWFGLDFDWIEENFSTCDTGF